MKNNNNMTPDYDLLVQQVKALGEEENYWLPVLANTSALLMNALPDLNWAGFYLMNSNAEIVIPIHKNGKLVGVLDLDSPLKNRFTEEDEAGLKKIVAALEEIAEFTD